MLNTEFLATSLNKLNSKYGIKPFVLGDYIEQNRIDGNINSNVRRLESIPNRQEVRDDRAFCSELWYNPGRFDMRYKKPDGGSGRTSGMQFRLDMGTSTGPSGLRGY